MNKKRNIHIITGYAHILLLLIELYYFAWI
jgi:hypothetical protein